MDISVATPGISAAPLISSIAVKGVVAAENGMAVATMMIGAVTQNSRRAPKSFVVATLHFAAAIMPMVAA